MNQFSIIIISYFSGNEIFGTIQSALSSARTKEIIIVDNGNESEIRDGLENIANTNPNFKIIRNSENFGFGKACNIGAKNIKEGALLFLNPDAKVHENALEKLGEIAPKTIVGGLNLGTDNKEQRGARRGELTISSAFISFLGLGKQNEHAGFLRDFNRHNEKLPNETIEVENISGAFFAINAQDFHAIGGFDEGYFLHLEDVDLCKRFRNWGGRVLFSPTAIATHIGGTAGAPKYFVEWHKYKGFMRYFWKNYHGLGKILVCLVALPLFLAIMGRLLLSKPRYE